MAEVGRRSFMRRLAVGSGCVFCGLEEASAATLQPSAPNNLRVVGKALLQPDDFSYVGFWELSLGADFCFGMGLAHRYVGGELRLLAYDFAGNNGVLREIIPPSVNGTASSAVASWTYPSMSGGKWYTGQFHGLYWDDSERRLLTTVAIDYPDDVEMMVEGTLRFVELGSSGTVTSVAGPYGLKNVGARRLCGGVVPIPRWFQIAYGVGKYGIGFGGYTSRMSQGLGAALGPVLYAIPDPRPVIPSGASLLSSQYKRLIDIHSGQNPSSDDWYTGSSQTTPTATDRGHRLAGRHTNSYEVGRWGTAPDGRGRFTWGDSYLQNCVWIDGPVKHGYLAAPMLHTGNTYYENSTLNFGGKTTEFHLYNPEHFGEVVQGLRSPANVPPYQMWKPAELPDFSPSSTQQGNNPNSAVAGVTYDAVAKRLYCRRTFAAGEWPGVRDRIHIFQVNA